jgi:prepilin-type N-terminal cleavage/methylation domain-containing protein
MNVRDERGLTLIEVLAATVILSIVVVGFLHMSGYLALSATQAERSAEALRIAEEQAGLARQYVREFQAPPPDPTVPGYTVTIQETDLLHNPSLYDTTSFGPHHVSVQSVVLLQDDPVLMTVTVSWE